MNLRAAREACRSARNTLDALRDAITEIDRLERGGEPNPHRPDPPGELTYAVAQVRKYLDAIEGAMK